MLDNHKKPKKHVFETRILHSKKLRQNSKRDNKSMINFSLPSRSSDSRQEHRKSSFLPKIEHSSIKHSIETEWDSKKPVTCYACLQKERIAVNDDAHITICDHLVGTTPTQMNESMSSYQLLCNPESE